MHKGQGAPESLPWVLGKNQWPSLPLVWSSLGDLSMRDDICVGVTKTHRLNDSPGRCAGLSVVALMAMIYLSERIQSQISKEKRLMGQPVLGKPGALSKGSLKQSHTGCVLIPPVMSYDNACERCQPWKLIRDSAPRVFIGSCRQPLLVTYQNSRLQRESRCSASTVLFVETS